MANSKNHVGKCYWAHGFSIVQLKYVLEYYLTMSIARYTISDWSIPHTVSAPALAENIDKIPVPQPRSSTCLP